MCDTDEGPRPPARERGSRAGRARRRWNPAGGGARGARRAAAGWPPRVQLADAGRGAADRCRVCAHRCRCWRCRHPPAGRHLGLHPPARAAHRSGRASRADLRGRWPRALLRPSLPRFEGLQAETSDVGRRRVGSGPPRAVTLPTSRRHRGQLPAAVQRSLIRSVRAVLPQVRGARSIHDPQAQAELGLVVLDPRGFPGGPGGWFG